MVAKGKDVSHLFPSVVKNVVSKNQEVGAALHVVYCLHMCYVWCVWYVCVCVMGIVRVAFTRSSGSLVSLLCLKNMAYVCGGHRSMCLSESFTLNHTGPCTPLLFTSSLPSSLPHLHRSRNWCTSTWCATRRSSRI